MCSSLTPGKNNNKIHVTTYCGLLGVRDLDPTSNIGRYANRPPTPQLHRYWYRTCCLLLVHNYTCILHQFHCLLNGLFSRISTWPEADFHTLDAPAIVVGVLITQRNSQTGDNHSMSMWRLCTQRNSQTGDNHSMSMWRLCAL